MIPGRSVLLELRAPVVAFGVCLAVLAAAPRPRRDADAGTRPRAVSSGPARFAEEIDVRVFARGNLHAHSTRSDGDSAPQTVVDWYADHGYDFIALTDHNLHVNAQEAGELGGGRIVVVPGEEVTMTGAGQPVHVTALCTTRRVGGGEFATAAQALAWATSVIFVQGGVALINHPNFHYAVSAQDIALTSGAQLLEVFSGHPHVASDGDGTRSSVEAKWDKALAWGRPIAAVAVDDMHALTADGPIQARPGTAWVHVYGAERSREAICDALARGRLYATSGPKLSRIAVSGDTFTVGFEDPGLSVEFVDDRGSALATAGATRAVGAPGFGWEATHRLRGTERYVRARVIGSDGSRAWTQAYRVTR